MVNISFSLWISLTLLFTKAAAQAIEEENECSKEALDNYNLGLRVGSIFIILFTSALGAFSPMIIHRIKPYQKGSAQDWVLLVGKFFGTGVILATAFIHMLPEAMENFGHPCLDPAWKTYGAFTGIFCMIASFGLQLLELAAVSNVDRLMAKQELQIQENTLNDIENTLTKEEKERQNNKGNQEDINSIGSSNTISSPPPPLPSSSSPSSDHHHHHHHHHHVHSAGLLESKNAFRDINTIILELGIVMHSIIIGITLANTRSEEFITLLIALVFHQFFEGIALGTRVNDLSHTGWLRPILMGLLYIVMTPIGIAIGIGIHSSFNPNSSSSILASAILDSLSAGILLYNAYVSLMSAEINHNNEFRKYSFIRKSICFFSMYVGAGIMALIGLWA
ncbi:Zinc/iron permease [Cunninghamella echinulata]|nr:Zinc/iron permease [Cunninghamella echinulata]